MWQNKPSSVRRTASSLRNGRFYDHGKCFNGQVPAGFLIADDHAIFAEALRVFLERTYPVVGVVADGRALIEAARRPKPEVIVVDVGMPVLNGLDAARRIKEDIPDDQYIFLTMRADPNLAAAALELGPIGFVLKQATGHRITKGHRSCAVWETLFAPPGEGEGLGHHKSAGTAVRQGTDPSAAGYRPTVCRGTVHKGNRGFAQFK